MQAFSSDLLCALTTWLASALHGAVPSVCVWPWAMSMCKKSSNEQPPTTVVCDEKVLPPPPGCTQPQIPSSGKTCPTIAFNAFPTALTFSNSTKPYA